MNCFSSFVCAWEEGTIRKKSETNDNTHTIKNAHFFICLYLLIMVFVVLTGVTKENYS